MSKSWWRLRPPAASLQEWGACHALMHQQAGCAPPVISREPHAEGIPRLDDLGIVASCLS